MDACILLVLALATLGNSVAAWFGPVTDRKTDSMFYISEDVTNQPQAAHSCRIKGWILATVKTPSQQEAIEKLATTVPGNSDIWIGLELYQAEGNNVNKKGYGIWSDGTPFNTTKSKARYHNWYNGEPLTFMTRTQTNKPTCVRLWKDRGWRWDDYYCDYGKASLSRYACETKGIENDTEHDILPYTEPYDAHNIEQYTESYTEPYDEHYTKHNVTTTSPPISRQHISNTTTLNATLHHLRNLSTTINDYQYQTNGRNLSQSEARGILQTLDNALNEYDARKDGKLHKNTFNLEVVAAIVGKNESLLTNYTNGNRTSNNIQIYLSSKLIEEASLRLPNSSTDKNYVQINTVLYRSPSLFRENRNRYENTFWKDSTDFESLSSNAPMFGEKITLRLTPILLSDVISVDVRNVDMSDLINPVCIVNYNYNQSFMPPQIPDMISNVRPICAFWDFNISQWSSKGCKVLEDMEEEMLCGSILAMKKSKDTVTCACNHMTHFSMLLDTTYVYAPKYLTHVTKLGCSISIICLLVTVTTILTFKQLRSKTPQQILFHLCLALFMINLLFLAGIDGRDVEAFCTAISALLHYFLLTAWAFMLLEAIFIFLRIVKASYRKGVDGKVVPIGSVICYVIPALISGITVAAVQEDTYLSKRYCWLSMEVLIPSLLVPVAIILSINILIFIAVFYTITFKSKMFRRRVDLLKVRQTLMRALCMVFLLGVPWIFGFFMLLSQHPSAKEVFAVCFTVFNTTQGVAIFIFYCAKQEQVRNLWLVFFNQKVPKAVQRARSSIRRPAFQDQDANARNDIEKDSGMPRLHKMDGDSENNQRSLATYPCGSRSTLDTDTMEGNLSQDQNFEMKE